MRSADGRHHDCTFFGDRELSVDNIMHAKAVAKEVTMYTGGSTG